MNESVARYRVGGVDCAASASEIQAAVARLPGITGVDVSLAAGTMSVRHEGELPAAAIDHSVKWLGHAILSLHRLKSLLPARCCRKSMVSRAGTLTSIDDGSCGRTREPIDTSSIGPRWVEAGKARVAMVCAVTAGAACRYQILSREALAWCEEASKRSPGASRL